METPSAIIYPYFRTNGYIYLHIPKRITAECAITSGVCFAAFTKDSKLTIEQQENKKEE